MLKSEQELVPYHSLDPTGKRVLVLAPHPDDETLGCGGALAMHRDAGDPVKVIILTNGAKGDRTGRTNRDSYVELRRQEALRACEVLGIEDVEFWEYEDRSLDRQKEAPERLARLLGEISPGLVYLPSPLEFHPDHRAAAYFGCEALRLAGIDCEVMFCEIGQPLVVNTLVDITPVLARKRDALAVYHTQLQERPYNDMALALNRFRAFTLDCRVSHAEGFFRLRSDQITALGPARMAKDLINRIFEDYRKLEGSRAKAILLKIKAFF